MLNWMGGYFETNWSVNPHWKAKFEIYPEHEAARGLEPFEIDDEWYFHMRFRGDMDGITPILSAIAPDETMKRGDGAHSGNPAVRKAVAAKDPQHVAWHLPARRRLQGWPRVRIYWAPLPLELDGR